MSLHPIDIYGFHIAVKTAGLQSWLQLLWRPLSVNFSCFEVRIEVPTDGVHRRPTNDYFKVPKFVRIPRLEKIHINALNLQTNFISLTVQPILDNSNRLLPKLPCKIKFFEACAIVITDNRTGVFQH